MAILKIPNIDFSSIFKEGDEDGKKKVIDEVGKACVEFGFFQVVNHGLPLDLLNHARDLSKTFFESLIDEKLKCKPRSTIFLAGYGRMDSFVGSNEWLMVFQPQLGFNVFPDNPLELGEKLEEIYKEVQKLGSTVENMINECLGLPVGFLGKYNDDRSEDALLAWLYPPATDNTTKLGRKDHQDQNCITSVHQDEVGGLEVEKDGKWIPIIPMEGALIVNIGSIIQVLTNKRMTAARQRVMLRNSERSRQSFAYFYSIGGDKWIEPLPQFTKEFGEAPKYRGFLWKDLLQARLNKEKKNPGRNKGVVDFDQYEINIAVFELFCFDRILLTLFISMETTLRKRIAE